MDTFSRSAAPNAHTQHKQKAQRVAYVKPHQICGAMLGMRTEIVPFVAKDKLESLLDRVERARES